MSSKPEYLSRVYHRRFASSSAYRARVWQVLTGSFFTRWIQPNDAVLDLGCGYGEFINNIRASRKYAMDLNPDAQRFVHEDVTFLQQDCSDCWSVPESTLDAIFTSNFFEHLPDKEHLNRTLQHSHAALKPGGRLIALGPNTKYLHGAYWDFYDHHVSLTEASLAEALEIEGFQLETVIPRFLPYTMERSPEYPMMFVRLYLALPMVWRVCGRQFLVIGRKAAT